MRRNRLAILTKVAFKFSYKNFYQFITAKLLKVTQKVENDLGRKREIRWGPRTIDLDILLYNQENIEAENLIVPHPRMFERAFVIVPLLEINQDIKQNISRSQVEEMKRREGVTVWKQKNGEDAFVLFEN